MSKGLDSFDSGVVDVDAAAEDADAMDDVSECAEGMNDEM